MQAAVRETESQPFRNLDTVGEGLLKLCDRGLDAPFSTPHLDQFAVLVKDLCIGLVHDGVPILSEPHLEAAVGIHRQESPENQREIWKLNIELYDINAIVR